MPAYPPPPGFKTTSSFASTPPTSSLPARPPPSTVQSRGFKPAFSNPSSSAPGGYGGAGPTGFTGFPPRALASSQPHRTASPIVSAGPQPSSNYSAQPTFYAGAYQAGYQQNVYYGQQYQDGYTQPTPPQIHNPFVPPSTSTAGAGGYGAHTGPSTDPDLDAQIAQWQSAYMAKDDPKSNTKGGNGGGGGGGGGAAAPGAGSATGANTGPLGARADTTDGPRPPQLDASGKPKTVIREGGGQKWADSSLLEWDPAHFRLFVGNLAGEVTDDSLLKAFARYPSVQKARVIRDKRTTKSKGFGFISFSDGDDYFKAGRDMQGKYIGSHPVLIKKSTTEIKAVTPKDVRHGGKGGKGGGRGQDGGQDGNGVLGPALRAGVGKKQSKTKGGLKVLG